jgi:hypothetical protein
MPRSFAFSLYVLISFLGSGAELLAQKYGFEADEGFKVGEDISSKFGMAANSAVVVNDVFKKGEQALKIETPQDQKAFQIPFKTDGKVTFIDLKIMPVVDSSDQPQSTIEVNGAILGFLKYGDKGSIIAVSGRKGENPGNSISTKYTFSLGDQDLATDWIRVTIREDADSGKWDLFLDGRLVLVNLALSPKELTSPNSLSVYSSSKGGVFVDDILISEINPLFPDADKDGIPDAVETVQGTDPNTPDRNALDARGISNIRRFMSASSVVKSPGGPENPHIVYVDNKAGNDEETGEFSYRVNGRGPKATIDAATLNAQSGSTVVLLPSGTPYYYREKSKDSSFTLNIVPVGDVSFATVEK